MKKNMVSRIRFVVITLLTVAIFASPVANLKNVVNANPGAILKVSPVSGNYNVGDSFQVAIKVDTGGEAVNAIKAYLTFSADKLEVTNLDYTNGSSISFWIEHQYDNSTGTIHLQGGVPTPGLTGADSTIATVTFRARVTGNASVAFDSSSKVLRNSDNVDILSNRVNGSYTLSTAPALDHFEISAIATQTAGMPFNITVTAKDANNNTFTGFNGSVTLTVNKGTISPSLIAVSSGVGTATVTIPVANTGVIITVSGGGKTGTSNAFDVVSLPVSSLDHFSISTIGTQISGVPFSVTITARDTNNNVYTSYNSAVSITVSKGSVSPTSVNLTNGTWTGNITVVGVNTSVVMMVTGGGKVGVSNSFDVNASVPSNTSYISLTRNASPDTELPTYTMGETISGTVVPLGGATLPSTIIMKDSSANQVAIAPVNASGQFSIPIIQIPLQEGVYVLDANIAQISIYIKYCIDSVSPTTAPAVGAMYVPITGRVFYGNIARTGVSNVSVALFGPSGNIVTMARTYQDGSFIMYANFQTIGKYTLRISDDYAPDFTAIYYAWTLGPTSVNVNLAVSPTLLYATNDNQTFTVFVSDPTTGVGIEGLSASSFSHSSGVVSSLINVTEVGGGFYNITVNPGNTQGSEIFKVVTSIATGYVTVSYQALGDWNPSLYIIPSQEGLAIGETVQFVYTTIANPNSTWFVKYTASDSGPVGSSLVNPDSPHDHGVRLIQSGGQLKYHAKVLLWNNIDPLQTQTEELVQDFTISPVISGDIVTCSIDSATVNDTLNITVTVLTPDKIEANNRTVVLSANAGTFKYPAPSGALYTVSADGSTATLSASSTNIVGGKYTFSSLVVLKQGYIEVKVYKGNETSQVLTADLAQAIKVSPKVVTLSSSVKHFVLGEDIYRNVKISGAVRGLSFTPAALSDNGDGSYNFLFMPSDINSLKYLNKNGDLVVTIQAYSSDNSVLYKIDIPVVKPVLQITSAHADGLITEGLPESVTFKLLDPDTNEEIKFSSPVLIAQYTLWDIYDNLPVSAFVLPTSKLTVNDQPTNSTSSTVVVAKGSKNVDYSVVTSSVGVKVTVNGIVISFPQVLKLSSPSLSVKIANNTDQALYYNVVNNFSVKVEDAHGNGVSGVQVVGIAPYSISSSYLFGGITDPTGNVAFNYMPTYIGDININIVINGALALSHPLTIKVIPVPPDTTAPSVVINEPEDGSKVSTSSVTVQGIIKDNVSTYDKLQVYLNDATIISLRPDGTFTQKVTLVEGSNTIKITAFDVAGNKAEKSITVTYEAPPQPVTTTITVQIGSDMMTVNGRGVQIDVPAEIKGSRTFVPLRAIAEAFGATVTWDADTKGITIVLGDTEIKLQVGNNSATVNGKQLTVDPAPYIVNGRTLVPLRFISEALGAEVRWDAVNKIATIIL